MRLLHVFEIRLPTLEELQANLISHAGGKIPLAFSRIRDEYGQGHPDALWEEIVLELDSKGHSPVDGLQFPTMPSACTTRLASIAANHTIPTSRQVPGRPLSPRSPSQAPGQLLSPRSSGQAREQLVSPRSLAQV